MCPYLLLVLPITYGRYILSALTLLFLLHHVKDRWKLQVMSYKSFAYKRTTKIPEWRITDSNR